jgi:uncharacterized OB-fold protein
MTTLTEQAWSQGSATDDTVSLVVQHCNQCGRTVFPPTAERCPQCWSPELAAEQTSGNGSVYSYTVVRRSFPGRDVPYIVGLVDLDGGLRVMATIAADESRVAVGTRVVAQAGSERPGMPATAYEFRPVD